VEKVSVLGIYSVNMVIGGDKYMEAFYTMTGCFETTVRVALHGVKDLGFYQPLLVFIGVILVQSPSSSLQVETLPCLQ
jgi:hypothetical protein